VKIDKDVRQFCRAIRALVKRFALGVPCALGIILIALIVGLQLPTNA